MSPEETQAWLLQLHRTKHLCTPWESRNPRAPTSPLLVETPALSIQGSETHKSHSGQAWPKTWMPYKPLMQFRNPLMQSWLGDPMCTTIDMPRSHGRTHLGESNSTTLPGWTCCSPHTAPLCCSLIHRVGFTGSGWRKLFSNRENDQALGVHWESHSVFSCLLN